MISSNLPATLKNVKSISSVLSKGLSVASNNGIVSKITNPVIGEHKFHISAKQDYPQAELKIPFNIDQSESTRFSPQRTRDITSNIIDSHNLSCNYKDSIDITVDNTSSSLDPHVEPYDSNGSINLNSSMQSNVPHPFGGMNKFTHLNMPGGQFGQGIRLVSNDMHTSHYTNLRRSVRMNWSSYDQNVRVNNTMNEADIGICLLHGLNDDLLNVNRNSKNLLLTNNTRAYFANLSSSVATVATPTTFSTIIARRMYSSLSNSSSTSDTKNYSQNDQNKKENAQSETKKPLTRQEVLKKAIKEYGSTVIVFHIGISLISLGSFYLLVSSGLDIVSIIEYFGWSNTALSNKLTTGASTFVIAYAVHKVFAPVRISITLGATPFIVRYLRNKGFLKKPISNK